MSTAVEVSPGFHELSLHNNILKSLDEIGYKTPSPIQALIIPSMLAGRDVVGQAQTGTGKTAAFALPLLSRLRLEEKNPQVLVLAPTRELALQVSDAFQRYGAYLKGLNIVALYGGQDYGTQLRALKKGAQIVVGTPGRVMDHIRRNTLVLDSLTAFVLDEADEMLRMGFIDDVSWIMDQTPAGRQIALFSATMPDSIRKIARKYLANPQEVTVKKAAATDGNIQQQYLVTPIREKFEALTRLLEERDTNGVLIFVRTKTATEELVEQLRLSGRSAACLHGDIPQQLREKTVGQFKTGVFDILVATDVAARGLDVDRVSHVINYDIPFDTESYVHRIGRTGRAGRSGQAILLVGNHEKRMLAIIERATGKKMDLIQMPTAKAINAKRIQRFKQKITDVREKQPSDLFRQLVREYQEEHGVTAEDLAVALAQLVQGDQPLLLTEEPKKTQSTAMREKRDSFTRGQNAPDATSFAAEHAPRKKGMERFRIEIGSEHGIKPGNIVGAITGETGLDAEYIGKIAIMKRHSLIDLPDGMPKEIFRILKKTWISGQQMQISKVDSGRSAKFGGRRPFPREKRESIK